jgi:hypothetical protein
MKEAPQPHLCSRARGEKQGTVGRDRLRPEVQISVALVANAHVADEQAVRLDLNVTIIEAATLADGALLIGASAIEVHVTVSGVAGEFTRYAT